MLRALSSAVSGLRTNQAELDVIGNNIANVNTVGFKGSQTLFADLLNQTIAGEQAPSGTVGGRDAMQIGLGSTVAAIRTIFTQGIIQSTNNPSDLAIQGEGFFLLRNAANTFYTRAGGFTLDANGTLVDATTGYRLQGANGDIQIAPGSMIPGSATTTEEFGGNLDASQADGATYVVTFSVNDSLGTAHSLALTFTKNFAANSGQWDYSIASADPNITGLTGNTGSVTFDTAGALAAGGTASLGVAFAAAAGVATPQTVTLDFGSASNAAPLTGNAADSTASLASQDGFAAGTLRQWSIGSDGTINASYDNGRNAILDTIQLATFDNPGGLLHAGQNLFTESSNSGIAHVGNPGAGGAGTFLPGALEGSNVDLARQFTDLITAQRGFEASARIIRVGDEILQTVVNIKQ
jgi:flagellar hook protein FlgE